MGKTVWCAYSEQELDFSSHWHFGNELILVCEGQMEVNVAEKKYTVSAGQMLLIQRLVHHFTERTSENFGRYCLIVQPNELHKSPVGVDILSHLTNSGEEPARLIDLKEDAKEAEHILSLVAREWNKEESFGTEYMLSAVTMLLALLCRHDKREALPATDERIFRVREDIDSSFTLPITISEIARRHFMSEDHLIHRFKQVTGFSPGQYIILNRLAYARELLASTDAPIAIVAQRSGFGDVNNFIRSFKKQFGSPPGHFRRTAK